MDEALPSVDGLKSAHASSPSPQVHTAAYRWVRNQLRARSKASTILGAISGSVSSPRTVQPWNEPSKNCEYSSTLCVN